MTDPGNTPAPGDGRAEPTERMPRRVRRALWGVVAGVVVLGVYLIVVRGPAMLIDLATGVANAFCF